MSENNLPTPSNYSPPASSETEKGESFAPEEPATQVEETAADSSNEEAAASETEEAQEQETSFRKRLLGYGIGILVALLPLLLVYVVFSSFTLSAPREFTGFKGPVTCVAISPDGRYVAASSEDKSIRVWELESGKEILHLTEREVTTNSLVFSPTGDTLLTGDSGDAFLWEIPSGKKLKRFQSPTNWVKAVAFSPDGKKIVTTSHTKTDWLIRLWDVETGEEIRQFEGHEQPVECVAFSPDGQKLLSSAGKVVILWDVATGVVLEKWEEAHEDTVTAVAFSPKDANRIATAGSDYLIRLRTLDDRDNFREFTGHVSPVTDIAFSPDGRYLVSCAQGTPKSQKEENSAMPEETRPLRIWHVKTGAEWMQALEFTASLQNVAFSPDGKYLVGGGNDHKVYVWRMP